MHKIITIILILGILLGGGYLFLKQRGMEDIVTNPANLQGIPTAFKPSAKNTTGMDLTVSDKYSISIYADNLPGARDLVKDPNGKLLVSQTGNGKVVTLPEKSVVIENLNRPHGLAFYNNKLYIAETNQVATYDYDLKTNKATNKQKIIDLPAGGNHFTRSLIFKDDKLYVSIGSTCNVCVEKDTRRAAIWVANPDGGDFKPYATGLRNSVFMTIHPVTKDIWATDMGRDLIGDNIPPEEVNIIKENNHYGWPYCWGDQVVDQETNPNNSAFNCNTSTKPQLTFQAHSAPLGLDFLGEDLLVAYHGSWNRSQPTGYKVVRFPLDINGKPNGKEEDFITGWLVGEDASGRPVDILVDGEKIYISDDKAGVVYLIEK